MTARILTLWRWLLGRFRPVVVTEPLLLDGALALAPAPEPAPLALPSAPATRGERELSVAWQFRTTILERLDEYFVCMRTLRKHDPESYALFSRTGFAVAADAYRNPETNQERLKSGTRPAFGGILCGGFSEVPKVECEPSFVYFKKIQRPISVQPHVGDVYELTMLYDNRKRARRWEPTLAAPVSCHLALDAGGQMTVLKERRPECSSFTHKRRDGRKEAIVVTKTVWAYPRWMTDPREPTDAEPFHLARLLFGMSLLTYGEMTDQIVVRATHEQCVAAFSIALPRAPRFFADRTTDRATDGKRKRIFHTVIEHERHLATRTVTVRAHYRGQRSFDWKDYRIHIVLPKNGGVLQFDRPMIDVDELPKDERPERTLTEGQVGQIFADLLAQ